MMTNDTDFDRLRLERKSFTSGYDYRSGCESDLHEASDCVSSWPLDFEESND